MIGIGLSGADDAAAKKEEVVNIVARINILLVCCGRIYDFEILNIYDTDLPGSDILSFKLCNKENNFIYDYIVYWCVLLIC